MRHTALLCIVCFWNEALSESEGVNCFRYLKLKNVIFLQLGNNKDLYCKTVRKTNIKYQINMFFSEGNYVNGDLQ